MPSSGPIESALVKALKEASAVKQDEAAVALATRYAQLLDRARGTEDEVGVVDSLGP